MDPADAAQLERERDLTHCEPRSWPNSSVHKDCFSLKLENFDFFSKSEEAEVSVSVCVVPKLGPKETGLCVSQLSEAVFSFPRVTNSKTVHSVLCHSVGTLRLSPL